MSATQLEAPRTVPETVPMPVPEPETSSGRTLAVEDDAPSTAVSALEKWNYPRHNIPRLMATFWSFVVSGANDAAYGVSGCAVAEAE